MVPGSLGSCRRTEGICLKVSTLSRRRTLKLIVSPPSLLWASVFVHMKHTLALMSRPRVVQWAWSLSNRMQRVKHMKRSLCLSGGGGTSPGRAGGEAAGLTRTVSAVVLERGYCSFSLEFRRFPGCWLGPLMATCTCTTWTPRKEASAP